MLNSNPFSENRAEFMKNLWKYYVPFKQLENNVPKPLVIEGGRGTGKTMFFKCNSWQEQVSKYSNSGNIDADFFKENTIGLYYKVDNAFVGAMTGEGRTQKEWSGIFSTYLSVIVIKELFIFLQRVENHISILMKKSICEKYHQAVHDTVVEETEFQNIANDCDNVLDNIEDAINNPNIIVLKFRLTSIGTIIKSIISTMQSYTIFQNTVFKIYIDEYESLLIEQQKLINTLIKQSNNLIIYNIGMRPKGMKTKETIGANEIIQEIHDYCYFKFDDLLNDSEYSNSLIKICQKRLDMFAESNPELQMNIPKDIKYYLGEYELQCELRRFETNNARFYNTLKKIIKKNSIDDKTSDYYIKSLCINVPPLNARLHLALLLRTHKYKPTLEYLSKCFMDWKSEINSKEKDTYDEWLHQTQNGIVFLLAKDYNVGKWYYGFDTFVALSSGVVRYFLELCEQTFSFALMNDFNWLNPVRISPEIQTKAAKYVSRNKVMEIDTYPLHGRALRIFVQCIGEIFKDLHRNDRLTLGEPEPNHFTTDSFGMDENEQDILRSSILWMVLQELPQTKGKENLKTSILDYHINKIYTPHFGISYNKKRKIELTAEELKNLLSGNISIADQTAKDYLTKYWRHKEIITSDIDNEDYMATQLSIFGNNSGDDNENL